MAVQSPPIHLKGGDLIGRIRASIAVLAFALGCRSWAGTYVESTNVPPPILDEFTLDIVGDDGNVSVSYLMEQKDARSLELFCGYQVTSCPGTPDSNNFKLSVTDCPVTLEPGSQPVCPELASRIDIVGEATHWDPNQILRIKVPDPFGTFGDLLLDRQ